MGRTRGIHRVDAAIPDPAIAEPARDGDTMTITITSADSVEDIWTPAVEASEAVYKADDEMRRAVAYRDEKYREASDAAAEGNRLIAEGNAKLADAEAAAQQAKNADAEANRQASAKAHYEAKVADLAAVVDRLVDDNTGLTHPQVRRPLKVSRSEAGQLPAAAGRPVSNATAPFPAIADPHPANPAFREAV